MVRLTTGWQLRCSQSASDFIIDTKTFFTILNSTRKCNSPAGLERQAAAASAPFKPASMRGTDKRLLAAYPNSRLSWIAAPAAGTGNSNHHRQEPLRRDRLARRTQVPPDPHRQAAHQDGRGRQAGHPGKEMQKVREELNHRPRNALA